MIGVRYGRLEKRVAYFIVCITWSFFFRPISLGAQEFEPFKVVIVQSYSRDYGWTGIIRNGVEDALANLKVEFRTYYLDAKNKPAPAHLKAASKRAYEEIVRFDPQVVIAVDDAAQEYLAAPYLKGKDGPQVVFCGVNAPLSRYGYPAANVTGVRERWHYREGFALLKAIAPQVGSIAFLIEESDAGGYIVDDLWEEYEKGGPFALELETVAQISTLREWMEKVRESQSKAGALGLGLYNSLVDETTGKVVSPDKVMEKTNAINNLPTLGFSDSAYDHDLLCGVLESGHEQGYRAGRMTRKILTEGIRAGAIPVEINVQGIVFVNLKTAERLGVRIPYELIEAAGVVIQ